MRKGHTMNPRDYFDFLAFLRARIAEDRQNAEALEDDGTYGTWSHWCRAICDAHQAIVDAVDVVPTTAMLHVLAQLGKVYKDHPDYDPQWAPHMKIAEFSGSHDCGRGRRAVAG